MVDDSRLSRQRVGTLSESSSEDSQSEGSDSNHYKWYDRPKRISASKSACIRESFDDNPELYGIRRSARSRKDQTIGRKFTYEDDSDDMHIQRQRVVSMEESESSYSDEPVYESRSVKRSKRQGRKSVRTRGNRVSYKSAFTEEQMSESFDSSGEGSVRAQPKQNQDRVRQLQNPKGSLIREPVVKRSARKMDQLLEDDEDEDEQMNSRNIDNSNEDCDIIEEILTHQIRRVGATGNCSTMYNCRLESDPNENFDSNNEEGELQYLIKWKNWSHIHSTWESEKSLNAPDRGAMVTGMKKLSIYQDNMRKFERIKQCANPDKLDELIYEEERQKENLMKRMLIERIVAHSRDSDSDYFDYLVKWQQLEYRHCTWESGRVIKELFPSAISQYKFRNQNIKQPSLRHEAFRIRPKFSRLTEQPDYIGDGNSQLKLREYQLNGLNWIAHAWTRGNSVILADEMGLGKTIQTVSFMSYLFNEHSLYGPFLLVVPLSTVNNWMRELSTWAPYMNTIVYIGDTVSRQLIREHEWSSTSRRNQNLKFNVCITTYEILLKDKAWLSSLQWAVLSVDEAHRLKNDQSQLYKALFTFNTNSRLLITGTPLQNSLKELWALLRFIMPNEFEDWEEFEEEYTGDNEQSKDAFKKLHRVLEPYLLRRVKRDVEYSLPAKIERVLRVEMTSEQAEVYRLILARNYDGLMRVTNGHKASFVNIVMELKKCCNHAFLIAPPSNESRFNIPDQLNSLVRGSGKLLLLDKLLLKLKPKGHRVLIFSQMVLMLNVIADYLELRGWGYQRLDGSVSHESRKQALDHFNAEGSTDFCFLLSTRAGGLGINLATADVVVIFDSDWNPQNDLQAQARAHRIGQTKQVSVYRLVTKDSIEEKIIESATRKMVLDHLVIQRMDSGGGAAVKKGDARGKVYSEILKYGAETLFKNDMNNKCNNDVDIEDILMRAETRDCEDEMPANHPANMLLSTFNVVNVDKLDETEPVRMDQSAKSAAPVKTWSEIIPEDMRSKVKEEDQADQLIKLELGPRMRKKVNTYQAGVDEDSDSSSVNNMKSDFSDKEIRNLVKSIRRFPRPLERVDSIIADAELPDKSEEEVRSYIENILNGCKMMMENASASEGSKITYTLGKVSIPVKSLLQNVEDLNVLGTLFGSEKEDKLKVTLPFTPKCVNWNCVWSDADDVKLLAGVYDHGFDNWESIKLDVDLGLGSKLLPVNGADRPQATHIKTRVEYLLKMLNRSSKGEEVKPDVSKVDSKRKSKSRGAKKEIHVETSTKMKSAEFVETDGSSSDDNHSVKESEEKSRKRQNKKSKRSHHDSKKPKLEDKSGPMHFTANKEPILIEKEEENDFMEMKGPVFDKCKKNMHPVKKTLQQLERLEDESEDCGPQFDSVVLKIGEHIRGIVREMEDKMERHKWRKFLWKFVGIFSNKTADQLQECYKKSHKHHHVHHHKEKDSHATSDQEQHSKHHHHSKHKKHKHDSAERSQPSIKEDKKYEWNTPHSYGSSNANGPLLNGRSHDRFDNAFNRAPGEVTNSTGSQPRDSSSRSHYSSSSRRSKHYNSSGDSSGHSSGNHMKSYHGGGRNSSSYKNYHSSAENNHYSNDYSSSGADYDGLPAKDGMNSRQQQQVISTIHANRDPRLAHTPGNTHNLSSTRCD